MFQKARSNICNAGSVQQQRPQNHAQLSQNNTSGFAQFSGPQPLIMHRTKQMSHGISGEDSRCAHQSSTAPSSHVLLTSPNRCLGRESTRVNVPLANLSSDEDYGDDVFEFQPETPSQQLTTTLPSSVISWPESHYNLTPKEIVSSSSSSGTHIEGRGPITLTRGNPLTAQDDSEMDLLARHDSSISLRSTATDGKHSSSTVDVFKKNRAPRKLPWMKDSLTSALRPGSTALSQRPLSTAAAAKEDDEEEEERVLLPGNTSINLGKDPTKMTQSAMKAARAAVKSRGNAKKRSAEAISNNEVSPTELARVFLSTEQRGVIDMLKHGKSVFFTGSAGTGKSVLLRSAIQELKLLHRHPEAVAVTASTGLAACNIGGITLHSFAGVGLGAGSAEELVKNIKKVKKNVVRWTKTKVLVIDEVSMIDADFFDKLEHIARKLKGVDKAWGGIQLVVTGDFFQLPPVSKDGSMKFAFQAQKWKALDATIQLKTVFRQKDEEFIIMLNEMRTGVMSSKTIELFKKLQRKVEYKDGLFPTELFPKRDEVDKANKLQLASLPGPIRTYDAVDSGALSHLKSCMATEKLEIKKGAQVMLIKNRDDGLVNGSLGVVIGFMDTRTYTFANEDGTFDGDGTDNGNDKENDHLWSKSEMELMRHTPAGERKELMMTEIQKARSAAAEKWPVVRFQSPNGGQDCTQLMTPETWKYELNNQVLASRRQVPLILSYAISIHKSQGQTLERVKVNLQNIFESGQAYVALSRAVSRDRLEIQGFNAKKVMVHDRVAGFYRNLADAPDAIQQHNKRFKTESTRKTLSDKENEDIPMKTQQIFSQIRKDPIQAFMRGRNNKF